MANESGSSLPTFPAALSYPMFGRKSTSRKIMATGGALGVSLTMVLLGISAVAVSLRKLRLTIDVNQDKDLDAKAEARRLHKVER
jgi:hypothetical protein